MPDSAKKNIDVVIGGRIFKLSASEEPDYIKNVAAYIDSKLRQLNVSASSNIMNDDNFAIVLALNIADDLFKEKESNNHNIVIDEPTPEQARQIAELKTQLASRINDYDLLLDQFQAKSSEVDGLKDTIYTHEDSIDRLNLKIDGYKTEAESNKKIIEKKSQYIIDLTKKINDKNQELNNLSKKLAEKNTALNDLNKKSAERNIKLNNVNKERDDLAVKLKSANNNIKALEKEAENNSRIYEDEKNALNKKIALLEENVKKLEHDNKAVTEDSAALKSEYESFRQKLENATDGQLKAAFAKTKAENIELRRTVEKLKTALSKVN